jgi:23S rRNA pseudouridine2605 synthase
MRPEEFNQDNNMQLDPKSDDRDGYQSAENTNNDHEGYSGKKLDDRSTYYNRTDRPQRPRFNRTERAYSSDGSNDHRPYRPNNNYRNDRYQNGTYQGQGSSDRPYRPRFQQGNNNNQSYGNRYQRPNGGDMHQGYGENAYRPRYNNDGMNNNYQGGDRPYRPRYNNDGNGGYQNNGYRPRFSQNGGGYQQRSNNPGGSYRPRFQQSNSPRYNGQRSFRPQTSDYDPNAKYSLKKRIEYKEENIDPNAPIRLNKFLANAGVCSRREADEFIKAGVVLVNNNVVTELGTKILRSDEVKFHDQTVSLEKKVYVLLNKPKDYVTTSDDPQNRKTVMELVKTACRERIYPVGRLDRNTTGVLLFTNDGDMASKLTHPKFLKKKVYHVTTDKNVTEMDMQKIREGITLEDGEVHADDIQYASPTDKKQVGIEIHSGKNRIVRRIFESLGYRVYRLDRVMFAGLTKKNLRRGDWRYLTEQEVNMLRMGAFE